MQSINQQAKLVPYKKSTSFQEFIRSIDPIGDMSNEELSTRLDAWVSDTGIQSPAPSSLRTAISRHRRERRIVHYLLQLEAQLGPAAGKDDLMARAVEYFPDEPPTIRGRSVNQFLKEQQTAVRSQHVAAELDSTKRNSPVAKNVAKPSTSVSPRNLSRELEELRAENLALKVKLERARSDLEAKENELVRLEIERRTQS